ncbi:polymeric immunoglobulin receptor-like [Cottoperca gobio]|uniref:polymeric immunoglobulin receptor-like n=1 Tax=Cottoperca gobio TaxID=56716 RepID=UPI00110D7DE7|nr:polymeric immunoglobulin receptor-like [Cottoperca gobio]
MWNLLLTLCIALSCVRSAAGLIHVSGYEGRGAEVSCTYEQGYESYEKYLCKKECSNEDVLITTTQAARYKYSIRDHKQRRVFTVTISDLNLTDAGIYWCGVTRNGKDIYTEVKLEVGKDSCCEQSTKVQSYEESSVSISCTYTPKHQDSVKYVCRGSQPSTCLESTLITSDNRQNGELRLTDDKVSSQFTVDFTSLTQKDSGSYLCGVHGLTGLDVFSAFELEVKEWCCVGSKTLSGIVGRPVTMQCHYPPQHRDNRKFLCKGDHRNNCTDMVTSQSRFTLQDDVSSSSFSVTIAQLKAGDAGTYWCGSHSRWSAGNYTKIHLSVVFTEQTSTEVEPVESQSAHTPGQQIKDASPFHPAVFIAPVLLLILTFALVIFYKYKVRGARANVNRNQTNQAETEEVIHAADIYANQDIMRSKPLPPNPESAYQHYDDAGEAQQDVYQNFTITDDIYCNQFHIEHQ